MVLVATVMVKSLMVLVVVLQACWLLVLAQWKLYWLDWW